MSTTSFFAVVPTSICASNLRRGPPTNNKQQGGPMKGCFRADMTDSKGVFLIFVGIEMNRLLSESSPKPISVTCFILLSSGSSGSASWDIGKFILIIMKLPLREATENEILSKRIPTNVKSSKASISHTKWFTPKKNIFFPCSFTTRDFEIVSFSFKLVWNSRLFSGLFPQFIQEESIWMRKKTLTRTHKYFIKMGKIYIYILKCDSTKFQKSRFQVFTPFCDSSCNQLFFVNPLLRDGMFWIHINNITNIRTPTCFTRSSPETFFPKNTLCKDVLRQQQRTKSLSGGLSPSFPATHVGFGGCACST